MSSSIRALVAMCAIVSVPLLLMMLTGHRREAAPDCRQYHLEDEIKQYHRMLETRITINTGLLDVIHNSTKERNLLKTALQHCKDGRATCDHDRDVCANALRTKGVPTGTTPTEQKLAEYAAANKGAADALITCQTARFGATQALETCQSALAEAKRPPDPSGHKITQRDGRTVTIMPDGTTKSADDPLKLAGGTRTLNSAPVGNTQMVLLSHDHAARPAVVFSVPQDIRPTTGTVSFPQDIRKTMASPYYCVYKDGKDHVVRDGDMVTRRPISGGDATTTMRDKLDILLNGDDCPPNIRFYRQGTADQVGAKVTGHGLNWWHEARAGAVVIWDSGHVAYILAVTSAWDLIAAQSQHVPRGAFTLAYGPGVVERAYEKLATVPAYVPGKGCPDGYVVTAHTVSEHGVVTGGECMPVKAEAFTSLGHEDWVTVRRGEHCPAGYGIVHANETHAICAHGLLPGEAKAAQEMTQELADCRANQAKADREHWALLAAVNKAVGGLVLANGSTIKAVTEEGGLVLDAGARYPRSNGGDWMSAHTPMIWVEIVVESTIRIAATLFISPVLLISEILHRVNMAILHV